MRILAIGHSWVVGTYRQLLRYLADLPGVELTVVVPDHWEEGGQRVYAERSAEDNFDLRIERPVSHRQHLHIYPTMPLILRQSKPDIVFLLEEPNSLVTAVTLLLANRQLPQAKGVFYTFLNDDRDFSRMPGMRRFLFPWAQSVSFRLASGAACASQASRDQMRKRGYDKDIRVIPFGTAVRRCSPDRAQALRLRQQVAEDADFLIGFVGRLTPAKGVDLLLRAVSKLPDQQGVRVAVVGDGEELLSLEQLAQDLGIAGQVRFVGRVPHETVQGWMAAFDVLVVPSRQHGHWMEQFGRVVVEGMASRVPIIGSDSGEIPHVIGEYGLIFRENDWADLRDKLLLVRGLTPVERWRMVESAYQYVLRTFDYEFLARQYYEWFRELSRNLRNGGGTSNSSLDKIGGGFALEQNRPLVETWGYDDSNFYQREH